MNRCQSELERFASTDFLLRHAKLEFGAMTRVSEQTRNYCPLAWTDLGDSKPGDTALGTNSRNELSHRIQIRSPKFPHQAARSQERDATISHALVTSNLQLPAYHITDAYTA